VISTPAADFSSFAAIVRRRRNETPAAVPFTYQSGSEPRQSLTYAQLDHRARSIAAWLQGQGLSGERVLVVYPSGLDFIAALFGCLYAGTVPIPAYPPHPAQLARTVPRLLAIIDDAMPAVALAPAESVDTLKRLTATAEGTRQLAWSQLPEDSRDLADQWKQPEVRPSDLALLQYTSGSTSVPKGVMLTHKNLLQNSRQIGRAFKVGQDACGVSWLPPFHDMGLIGCVFHPVYSGITAHLMSPLAFLQRPLRWLQAISSLRAEVSGGPNFAYDFCVRRISDDDKKHLDLSCWKTAFNGAEPVQWKTLERFADAFRECGFRSDAFYPCYGLAEATLMVSAVRETASPRVLSLKRSSLEDNRVDCADESNGKDVCTVMSCGRAAENVAIVSPESLIGCAEREIGEIWVSGASVALGYWKRPEETKEAFAAYRADTGEGPFFRTGDLGFQADGELFVTGRLKDLIIIAGRNHYPNDIEITVEASHPSIRSGCCAAFSVTVDEEERLVVAAEIDRRPASGAADRGEVTLSITRAIAEVHEVQVHAVALLKPGSIPKTSSGKIQRKACKTAFVRSELNSIGD
jgi:acyl-CoA synthetase (AMP-forming)/AMP-acid ligase II